MMRKLSLGTRCHIIGFGHLIEDGSNQYILNEAVTPILSRRECTRGIYADHVSRRMMCTGYTQTGGVGICHVSMTVVIKSVIKYNNQQSDLCQAFLIFVCHHLLKQESDKVGEVL